MKHRLPRGTSAVVVSFLLLSSVAAGGLREDLTPRFAKIGEIVAPAEPKPDWQTVMHAQEADEIVPLERGRFLVSEVELLGADIILSFEGAKPVYRAISTYDAETGTRVWTHKLKRPKDEHLGILRYSLVSTSPSIVLMGLAPNLVTFTGLEPATGKLKWKRKFGKRTSATVSPDGATIIAASAGRSSAKLTAINASDGAVRWQRDVENLRTEKRENLQMIPLDQGVLVIGETIHHIPFQAGHDAWSIQWPTTDGRILSAESRTHGTLVWGQRLTRLLDRRSGATIWEHRPLDSVVRSEMWNEDAVYIHTRSSRTGDDTDHVVVFHAGTGDPIWTHAARGLIRSPMLPVNDKLCFTNDDSVICLDLSSGEQTFRSRVPGAFDMGRSLGGQHDQLPDLLSIHDGNIIAIRESYGVVAVSPETGEIVFAQAVPMSWSEDYTFSKRKEELKAKTEHFAKRRREKDPEEKLQSIDTNAAAMNSSVLGSLQRSARDSSSLHASKQARLQAKRTTEEISRRMETGELTGQELQDLQAGRRLNTQSAVMESRARAAALGIQSAAIRVSSSMDQMIANMEFCNSVTGAFFSAIEAAQAEVQRSALTIAQLELAHAMKLHQSSIQNGFYVRPIRRPVEGGTGANFTHGVTLVNLGSGERADVFFGALFYDMVRYGLELPSYTITDGGRYLIVDGIGFSPSLFEPYKFGKYVLPYPSVMTFDLSTVPFKKKGFPNPDILRAARIGNADILQALTEGEGDLSSLEADGVNALLDAVRLRQFEIAKYLVEHGVDVNADIELETPLKNAVANEDVDLVKYLIEKGADVNVPHRLCFVLPLSTAAAKGNLEIVQILLDAGADVNRLEGFFSPLRKARAGKEKCKSPCEKPYDEVIDLLLQTGAKE